MGEIENSNVSESEENLQAIKETGEAVLKSNQKGHKIHLMSIIGEIEGHECLGGSSKTTKYEHILPKLATIEDDPQVDGVLILLNTMGGDVEAGLAIAEMIASLSKPTVSLVLGGSHSIGIPIAVSADYSFIVKTGTMVIHPVRLNGLIIGVAQTFEYFKNIQDRITGFIVDHSNISEEKLISYMMETKVLTKDVGSILVGKEVVDAGLIDAVGGIKEAIEKLHMMINEQSKPQNIVKNQEK